MTGSALGIRCSNTDYAAAVLSGSKTAPRLVETKSVPFPKGFSKAQILKWLSQEIEALISKHAVERVAVKGAEHLARGGRALEDRVECEGVVILAAANRGIKTISKKVKSTIAKDLGKKGRARYLATLDTSQMSGFDELPEKTKEAVLAAWSELN